MEFIQICEYKGEAVTTSRAVAEQFGKQHKNVIRDIEEIISQINRLNFEPVNPENDTQLNQPKFGAVNSENEISTPKIGVANPENEISESKIGLANGTENELSQLKIQPAKNEHTQLKIEPSKNEEFADRNFILSEYTGEKSGSGEVVGVYDDFTVSIYTTELHKLYVNHTGDNIPFNVWIGIVKRKLKYQNNHRDRARLTMSREEANIIL